MSKTNPLRLPNRIVIGAIDSALNRVDAELFKCADPHPLMREKIAALEKGLREERAALQEARNFIIDKRKD
jgi:hypothetical protein